MLKEKMPVKIYGLPRSGTNFLEFMLDRNFALRVMLFKYGWKHGVPELHPLPSFFVVKNPYSWLWSVYNFAKVRTHIFHIENGVSFPTFVTGRYVWDADIAGPGSPHVLHSADNPVVYWNRMNALWAKMALTVRFEDLLFDTSSVFDDIAEFLQLRERPSKIIWPDSAIRPAGARSAGESDRNVFGKSDFIKNRLYMKQYTPDLVDFVESHLDSDLRNELGYAQE